MELHEPIEALIHDPTEYTRNLRFPEPSQLRLYDETLRDGEQMPGICYTPAQKLEIAKVLAKMGVHIMSVGFPAASESDRLTLEPIMQAKRRGELGDVELVVMCRSNNNDIDLTIRAIRDFGFRPSDATFLIFTSGSDLHLKYKIGKILLRSEGVSESEWLDLPLSFYRRANLRLQCDAIKHARQYGVESIEFGGEDSSRADVSYMVDLYQRGLEAGGTRPLWADTVGCLTPEAMRWHGTRIVGAIPKDISLGAHLHNDYGLATINAITATACGFQVISVTANGYGERAGNVKLHEYVVALRALYGIDIPGFRYDKLRDLARFMEHVSGVPLQPHEPIIGTKVFTHESGIHAHGVLVDRRMYESVAGQLVGAETEFVFGKHSGVAIVESTLRKHSNYLSAHGVEVTAALAHKVTDEVKRLREEESASRAHEHTIDAYTAAMRRMSRREDDVITIALALARPDHKLVSAGGI